MGVVLAGSVWSAPLTTLAAFVTSVWQGTSSTIASRRSMNGVRQPDPPSYSEARAGPSGRAVHDWTPRVESAAREAVSE